jgi:hypothetical protein
MKKFLVVLAVTVSSLVFGQVKLNGEARWQYEQDFLVKYGVTDYLSLWSRYIYSDSTLFSECSHETQKRLHKKFKAFVQWNSDSSFKNSPDTISEFYGDEFLIEADLDLIENRVYSFFNYNTATQYTKILGYKKYFVGRDEIKSIIIVEYFDILGLDNTTLSSAIIIEYFDGSIEFLDDVKDRYPVKCDYCITD